MYGLGFRGAVYKLAKDTQSGLYCFLLLVLGTNRCDINDNSMVYRVTKISVNLSCSVRFPFF